MIEVFDWCSFEYHRTAIENPRVEFRDGQFLFRMMNQEGGVQESFKSHASVREAFSGIAIDSGWLRPEIVRWGDGRIGEWAVAFIPPGVHELELTKETVGSQQEQEAGELPQAAAPVVASSIDRIKTLLPGLVFFGLGNRYFVWAVKTPQINPYHEVYRCPLPNVEANALICWGPLKPPRATARTIFDAFDLFIKSTFNNHRCEGKSNKYRDDVRLMLRLLGQAHRADEHAIQETRLDLKLDYPVDDLMRQVKHTGLTLDNAMREYFETGEMPE